MGWVLAALYFIATLYVAYTKQMERLRDAPTKQLRRPEEFPGVLQSGLFGIELVRNVCNMFSQGDMPGHCFHNPNGG